MREKIRSDEIISGILNSYSQVFFATNRLFAVVLILVSLIDINSGLAGFISVIVANITAYGLGFNRNEINKGLFGFNSLLVGLGIGYFFQANIPMLLIVIAASILTLFFVTFFRGILQKYGLPYLSVPFLFGLWTIMISSKSFEYLGISTKGIFTLNHVYGLGGPKLVELYEWLCNIPLNESLRIYFNSIGAIFFQFNAFPGILLSIGLLAYSRIAFLLSVYGFYLAYAFYSVLGGNISELGYSYIGFNYILTAIAIGGYFMIPSRKTFGWLLLLIPLVSLVSVSLSRIFTIFQLSVYSLPFNIIVLLFLYTLKFRIKPREGLTEVLVQQGQPERNLYSYHNQKINAFHRNLIPFKLPFYGSWMVSQGHEGKLTHKEAWRYAWDFILPGENGKQFKNEGLYPQDYHCYGKSVIAPGAGVVEEIINNIPDNEIGISNLNNNWGNTVIIKHSEYLYSSLNHLKTGSVTVKPGERVLCGQKVAEAGNSGRSPYPHLHFQFQLTPYIGSETYKYPISYYMLEMKDNPRFKTFEYPLENELVKNIDLSLLMRQRFSFIPGQKLEIIYNQNGEELKTEWEIHTNAYNQSYVYDPQSQSVAYYVNDGNLLYFTHFEGSENSLLYFFYLGFYKILLASYKEVKLEDEIPQNIIFRFPWIYLQDFLAPFFLFLKAGYSCVLTEVDNPLQPMELKFKAKLEARVFRKKIKEYLFRINIKYDLIHFEVITDGIKIHADIR